MPTSTLTKTRKIVAFKAFAYPVWLCYLHTALLSYLLISLAAEFYIKLGCLNKAYVCGCRCNGDTSIRLIKFFKESCKESILCAPALFEIHNISNGEFHPIIVGDHGDHGLDRFMFNLILLDHFFPCILGIRYIITHHLVDDSLKDFSRQFLVTLKSDRQGNFIPKKSPLYRSPCTQSPHSIKVVRSIPISMASPLIPAS